MTSACCLRLAPCSLTKGESLEISRIAMDIVDSYQHRDDKKQCEAEPIPTGAGHGETNQPDRDVHCQLAAEENVDACTSAPPHMEDDGMIMIALTKPSLLSAIQAGPIVGRGRHKTGEDLINNFSARISRDRTDRVLRSAKQSSR